VSINIKDHSVGHSRLASLGYWGGSLLLLVGIISSSQSVQADGSCWLSNSMLNFGSVSTQGKSSSTSVQITCNHNLHQKTVNVTLCPYATAGGLGLLNNRRQLISYTVWPHSYLSYDLFYDPALSQRIDTQADISTLRCMTRTIEVNEAQKVFNFPLYGFIYTGQNVNAGFYQNNNDIAVTLRYGFSQDKVLTAADVLAIPSSKLESNVLNVTTDFANSCNLISTSDLSFGQINDLKRPVTSSTAVALSCPLNTVWKVSLDMGLNASDGTRRMRKGTDYIAYGLFRDAQYTQPWDSNTISQGTGNNGQQSINIYGKVNQNLNAIPAGDYIDTITVKLTY